jgi:hypothetical protein
MAAQSLLAATRSPLYRAGPLASGPLRWLSDGRRLASSTAEKWVQYAPRERLSLDNRSPHKGWAPELGQGISKGWLGIA